MLATAIAVSEIGGTMKQNLKLTGVTEILKQMASGDISARDELFTKVYEELRVIARARLRESGPQTLLDTTSLIHESYLKLVNTEHVDLSCRRHFFAYASKVMRSIIIDLVREAKAERHGGGLKPITLNTAAGNDVPAPMDLEAVHDALTDLEKIDLRLAQVVELKFFGGLTEPEIGIVMEVSERTVRQDWQKARAVLIAYLDPD
jgi:RNA polymerase sigma factor (TIGR02999 family)